MTEADLTALVQTHGLAIIAPLALIEGPVISVIAGYLARLSLIGLPQVFACLVLADLVGDALMYLVGRRAGTAGVAPWLGSLGLSRKRMVLLRQKFRVHGDKLIVLGKLTHSAGFAVLVAAGMARMPFGRFLALNLLATLPKTGFFLALGWVFGAINSNVEDWLIGLSALVIGALILFAAITIYRYRKERR